MIPVRAKWYPGHLGYRNVTILAILNLYVAPMPLVKFRLNSTYGLGGDVVWRISRGRLAANLGIRTEQFSNSESQCRYNASHQVSTQSAQGLGGDVVWRISRWPLWRPSWISEQNDFSNSESLCRSDASCQVSVQSDFFGGDVVWRISRWPPWQPSWISERNDFSNSEFPCPCCHIASH